MTTHETRGGFMLIDVVVGVSIFALVFAALATSAATSARVMADDRQKDGSLTLMTQEMEYLRALPYADVGTVGGTPPGGVLPFQRIKINGFSYLVSVTVTYINGSNDYKVVWVDISWVGKSGTLHTTATTYRAPENP